jgi:hypothetical protein
VFTNYAKELLLPDDHPTTNFYQWLKHTLNSVSEECASYVRQRQEGVPENASNVHEVLLDAWDAYGIVVALDKHYEPSRELTAFLEANKLVATATFEQRVELLDRYYEQVATPDLDAPEYAQARSALMTEVRKVFRGESSGEVVLEIFANAFREDEEDDLEDDEPAAVIYIYDTAWAARAAYNGEQPPFDRAEELRLVRWNPLDEDDKEVLRDILETQRGADGHLDHHLERIMEKLSD